MKKRIQLVFYAAAFLLTAAALALAGQTLWVTSESADLKADRSVSADTVAELSRGSELTVQTYESRWYQVTTADGQTGWVYRGKVSETKPEVSEAAESEGGGIGGLLGGLGGSSVEADAADSARSIRGLSPEAQAYAEKTGTPKQSQEALDQVLSTAISESEIESFLQTGKIGEYAE